jgi:hypothetical protein
MGSGTAEAEKRPTNLAGLPEINKRFFLRRQGVGVEGLEALALVYFDDFFELSGKWPKWLQLDASSGGGA